MGVPVFPSLPIAISAFFFLVLRASGAEGGKVCGLGTMGDSSSWSFFFFLFYSTHSDRSPAPPRPDSKEASPPQHLRERTKSASVLRTT